MRPINTIYGKRIDEILISLDQIVSELNGINMVYISIGGKINDKDVYFARPANVSGKAFPVNSMEQMVPVFLRNLSAKDNDKALVIIIDNFNSKPIYDLNKNLLTKLSSETTNIILIHHYFTEVSLTLFIKHAAVLCKTNQISPDRVMICNYVKHMNKPNFMEERDERMIPLVTQTTLNTTEYFDCFYEWFGYNFYLYNFIYKYRRCVYLNSISTVRRDLEYLIHTQYSLNKNATSVIQDNALLRFMCGVYDITELKTKNDSRISISLCELLVNRGRLTTPPTDMPEDCSSSNTQFEVEAV